MCSTCGGHADEAAHDHKHDHEHAHSHGEAHGHKHTKVSLSPAEGNVLAHNSRSAQRTRDELTARGIVMVNITSAPGSGKTALLRSTLSQMEPGTAAVLVGDLETDRDAARLRGLGTQVRQINTGKGCHLSAAQVSAGLDQLKLDGVEMVFVENVGNMACPSDYDLGEHARVAMLSLPEGDDKAAKYPGLFAAADVVLLNKVDLASVLPFNEDLLRQDLARLNTRAPLLRLSAVGGQGLDTWVQWLQAFRVKTLGATAKA
jgi:hydrogenase nickel incorporation protein HypB